MPERSQQGNFLDTVKKKTLHHWSALVNEHPQYREKKMVEQKYPEGGLCPLPNKRGGEYGQSRKERGDGVQESGKRPRGKI